MREIEISQKSSRGYAIGSVYLVHREKIVMDQTLVSEDQIENEIQKYKDAVAKAKLQLTKLAKQSDIFQAYLQLVDDIALYECVIDKIHNNYRAEVAVNNAIDEFIVMLDSLNDEYMKDRVADLKDIKKRLIYNILGIKENSFKEISRSSIIVAEELTPSDTANMDFDKIQGFVVETGGATSHVAIIAKSKGIPCFTGATDICKKVSDGMLVAMDAEEGILYLQPTEEILNEIKNKELQLKEKIKEIEKESGKASETKDGQKFMVCANVGSLEEIKEIVSIQMDGIGLFRSEFLYMQSDLDFPTEEEQFQVYKEAAMLMGRKELIIRTLDIGGDKSLNYYNLPKEDNPFLGCRAIRLCLKEKEMFKTQLRALLRASAYGNIKIMYPMIISLEELIEVNKLLDECKKELEDLNIKFNKDIEVGMMIETPSSVILANEFAKHVKFFSIGTNDLTQYLLAVDRGNEDISYLYNSFHPTVLKAIAYIIKCAHENGIRVGMCGEFASDERATQILLGMGLDEFSMAASSIKSVKYILRNSLAKECKTIAEKALNEFTVQGVLDIVNNLKKR